MGPCCAVYARCALTDSRLDRIAAHLAGASRPRVKLRRGLRWSLQIYGRPIDVHVERTAEVLWDCEDELLALGLLPEDAPFRVVLCAGCNAAEDRELLRQLGQGLATLLDGVPTNPTK